MCRRGATVRRLAVLGDFREAAGRGVLAAPSSSTGSPRAPTSRRLRLRGARRFDYCTVVCERPVLGPVGQDNNILLIERRRPAPGRTASQDLSFFIDPRRSSGCRPMSPRPARCSESRRASPRPSCTSMSHGNSARTSHSSRGPAPSRAAAHEGARFDAPDRSDDRRATRSTCWSVPQVDPGHGGRPRRRRHGVPSTRKQSTSRVPSEGHRAPPAMSNSSSQQPQLELNHIDSDYGVLHRRRRATWSRGTIRCWSGAGGQECRRPPAGTAASAATSRSTPFP